VDASTALFRRTAYSNLDGHEFKRLALLKTDERMFQDYRNSDAELQATRSAAPTRADMQHTGLRDRFAKLANETDRHFLSPHAINLMTAMIECSFRGVSFISFAYVYMLCLQLPSSFSVTLCLLF
jgi:hypothetical protein